MHESCADGCGRRAALEASLRAPLVYRQANRKGLFASCHALSRNGVPSEHPID
jgi:hypothetical protein